MMTNPWSRSEPGWRARCGARRPVPPPRRGTAAGADLGHCQADLRACGCASWTAFARLSQYTAEALDRGSADAVASGVYQTAAPLRAQEGFSSWLSASPDPPVPTPVTVLDRVGVGGTTRWNRPHKSSVTIRSTSLRVVVSALHGGCGVEDPSSSGRCPVPRDSVLGNGARVTRTQSANCGCGIRMSVDKVGQAVSLPWCHGRLTMHAAELLSTARRMD